MESLKTILYFSIFRYPLKLDEIHGYTNYPDLSQTEKELQQLVAEKILTKIDQFYVYGSDLDCVTKRLRGNIQAKKALKKAHEKAKLIARFPFVEGIGVSGSLSKGYYDSDSDIDFFIITRHNKLWLCRTLLMLYKKLFLFNSHKYFCINYFISSQQLEIDEKNRFTATELKTLIPMHGGAVFNDFYNANQWISGYFSKFEPNYGQIPTYSKPRLTQMLEWVLDNGLGNLIDNGFKLLTLRKWKSKFNYLSEDDFKVALKSTRNISKHHPSHFQKKVILSLNTKLEEVQLKYNLDLQREHA